MSLIDLASMVLAPTAVKDGKVYNAIPNDQDFTFSRGTEATRVNSAGLIEKARTNLLLQSNTFDTTWSTTSASVTGGQSGYDGTNDAWLFSRSSSIGYLFQLKSLSASINTISIYVKQGTSSTIRLDFVTGAFVKGASCTFDLSNGTAGSVTHYGSSSGFLAAITDVSNGWYRISLTGVTTVDNWYHELALTSGNVVIQNAQLEQGLVSTDVITTTTTSVTVGITDDLPRVDYSGGGCPSLLLEPSRTNLITQSEYFGAWTNDTNTILTPNAITSPSGLVDAYKLIAGTSTARQGIKLDLTPSGDVVQSVFAKKGEYSVVQITDGRNGSLYANFDLENGVLGSYQDCTPSIQEFSDGWYRCVIVYNSTLSIVNTRISIAESTTQARLVNFAGNGSDGIYIWGAMVEEGSYVSSYIPTYGTSTSRSADSCSLTNASNLIGQSEGTLFVEYTSNHEGSAGERIFAIGDGTSSNRIVLFEASNKIRVYAANGGSLQWDYITTIDFEGTHKIAVGYAENNAAIYIDGTQLGTDNIFNVPSCSVVYVGTSEAFGTSLGGGIKQSILFPTRLTNDQLEELTK